MRPDANTTMVDEAASAFSDSELGEGPWGEDSSEFVTGGGEELLR